MKCNIHMLIMGVAAVACRNTSREMPIKKSCRAKAPCRRKNSLRLLILLLLLVAMMGILRPWETVLGENQNPPLAREYIYMDGQAIVVEEGYRTLLPIVVKPNAYPYP